MFGCVRVRVCVCVCVCVCVFMLMWVRVSLGLSEQFREWVGVRVCVNRQTGPGE